MTLTMNNDERGRGMREIDRKIKKWLGGRSLAQFVTIFVLLGLVLYGIIFALLLIFVAPTKPDSKPYDFVTPAVTILGVVTVGGAAAIQYRKQKRSEEKFDLERIAAERELDAKFTELLTKAIEHLGHKKSIAIRTGALYELKRLAQDSEKDRENVLEIINRFVIEKWEEEKLSEPGKTVPSDVATAKEIMALLLRTEKIDHEKLNLSGAHLEGENLEGASLDGAHLEGADLVGAHLNGAHLAEAHLDGAHLDGAHLNGVYLSLAHLDGAHLLGAHLNGAHLDGANLNGADLSGAHLFRANLFRAHLDGAHLAEADLRGAVLSLADLRVATLRVANLSGADLSGAILWEADLNGADLTGADLRDANLSDANLRRADLYGAYLSGADLRHAQNLTADQLMYAYIDETTKLDDDLRDELIRRDVLKPPEPQSAQTEQPT